MGGDEWVSGFVKVGGIIEVGWGCKEDLKSRGYIYFSYLLG